MANLKEILIKLFWCGSEEAMVKAKAIKYYEFWDA